VFVCGQMEDIEKEIETAIANDEIYAATVPLPPSTATWLEFREYEVPTVFICRRDETLLHIVYSTYQLLYLCAAYILREANINYIVNLITCQRLCTSAGCLGSCFRNGRHRHSVEGKNIIFS